MEKQQFSDKKFDNGFQELFERYPTLRSKYVKGVTAHLKKIQGAKIYDRHQISRVINGDAPLNSDNIVIKQAFINRAQELIPDIQLANGSGSIQFFNKADNQPTAVLQD